MKIMERLTAGFFPQTGTLASILASSAASGPTATPPLNLLPTGMSGGPPPGQSATLLYAPSTTVLPDNGPWVGDSATGSAASAVGTIVPKPYADDPAGEELFSQAGPLPTDVYQGQLGDCYIDAPLAAMAQSRPDALKDIVKPALDASGAPKKDDSGRPLYDVTLNYKGKPETYTINDAFLLGGLPGTYKGNNPVKDGSNGKAVMWPALVEKGLAMFAAAHPDVLPIAGPGASRGPIDTSTPTGLNAAYDQVGNGGNPNWVLQAMTGQTAQSASGDATLTAAKQGALTAQGATATFTVTLQGAQGAQTLPSGAKLTYNPGNKNQYTYTTPDGRATLLPNNHAYAILGQSGDDLVLYNPQGKGEDNGGGVLHIAMQDMPALCQTQSLPAAKPVPSA